MKSTTCSLLILFLFLSSCSNKDKEIQDKANVWVESNIFPLLNAPKLFLTPKVNKIKNREQAQTLHYLYANAAVLGLTDPGSAQSRALKNADDNEFRYLSLVKTFNNCQEEAYSKISDKGYSVDVTFRYKNWKGVFAESKLTIVFNESLKILNPKIVSFTVENSTATFYKLN